MPSGCAFTRHLSWSLVSPSLAHVRRETVTPLTHRSHRSPVVYEPSYRMRRTRPLTTFLTSPFVISRLKVRARLRHSTAPSLPSARPLVPQTITLTHPPKGLAVQAQVASGVADQATWHLQHPSPLLGHTPHLLPEHQAIPVIMKSRRVNGVPVKLRISMRPFSRLLLRNRHGQYIIQVTRHFQRLRDRLSHLNHAFQNHPRELKPRARQPSLSKQRRMRRVHPPPTGKGERQPLHPKASRSNIPTIWK